MSTRDDILDALSEIPEGLTLKQLAEFCMACEHDEQVVGTMIAILDRENVIHAGPELRDGLKVWIFGKEPVEVCEAHISLAGAEARPGSSASEAARAVANMRGGADVRRRPLSAAAAGDADVATMQAAADGTTRENVLRILKAHGPLKSLHIRRHGSFGENLPHTLAVMAEKKQLVTLGGGPRSTIFGLPGQTLKDRKADKKQPAKGREPAPLSRDANGGGGAVTSAAGPATAAEPKTASTLAHPDIHPDLDLHGAAARAREAARKPDNLYLAALLDLQERRDAMAAEIGKLDRAIEAVRALT